MIAGLYAAPLSGSLAPLWEPNGTGVLTLTSGDIPTVITQSLILGVNNKFTRVFTSAIPSLRLPVNGSSGGVA